MVPHTFSLRKDMMGEVKHWNSTITCVFFQFPVMLLFAFDSHTFALQFPWLCTAEHAIINMLTNLIINYAKWIFY